MRLNKLIFLLLFLTYGCDFHYKSGNGNVEEVQQEIAAFENLYIGGNFRVVLVPSNSNAVLISADENLLKYINVESRGDALHINTVHSLKSNKGISITVKYTHLSGIYATGASKITHDDLLKTQKLQIDLSGTGSIELEMEVDTTEVNMTGAGLVKLAGKTTALTVDISGAGGLMASDLVAQNGDVSLSGVGGASIHITDYLKASITGVGGIQYAGNPSHIEKNISGFGKITQSEE